MGESAARSALQAAMALPIQLHSEADLHEHAMLIAGRFSLPAAYDAHYLALAEMLTATFWTSDRKLAQVVEPTLSWVHLAQP
jgi:predicted nucleic acid-binding protein